MARKTKWARWSEGAEEAALAHFDAALAGLRDPRRAQGMRYPLRTVVMVSLMSLVCGGDDAEAMQTWGEANEAWLATFLDMPHGSPSQDVFLSVFAALDPEQFRAVFAAWMRVLTLRFDGEDRHIAVDGKTSRGSADAVSGLMGVHTVSAWWNEAGLVLAQADTDRKSNEMKAMGKLLRTLDLQGATVTIDAMGTHREIAETIHERGGEYILPVKDNQPTLRRDIAASFADALDERRRPLDQPEPPPIETFEEVDKSHGRLEERTVHVCRDLSWLTTADSWAGLSFMAMVVRRRTDLTSGATSTECIYYIGSSATDPAERIASRIRGHWSVENSLHWTLDVAFHEDRARHRAGNCARNMAILRHMALNLLKSEPTHRLGVANRRKAAGWDRSYLLQVLTGPRS